MSGHSKWATTKRRKAAVDSKRSKLFSKLSKVISIAARDGGGDIGMNPKLKMAVENARTQSMPRENIDRAIKRGTRDGDGSKIEEIIYEAFGSDKSAFLIECLTDNKNRALAEVKHTLAKNNGSLVQAGNVAYLFEKKGEIIVDESKNNTKGEDLEMAIIDSGAEDFEKEDDLYFIYTRYQDLNKVSENLKDFSIKIDTAELTFIPSSPLDVENKELVENLIEALDELEDVNRVFTNVNL